jgi:hypothetical protein
MNYDGPSTGYNFRGFLDLVQKANLTLKVEPNPMGEGTQDEIRFNYFDSVEKYSQSLNSNLRSANEELEEALFQKYEKLKKLDYLTRYLTDIMFTEQMVAKDSAGQLSHIGFDFVNVSELDELKTKTRTQKDAQQFLEVLNLYLYKCKTYIIGLQNNIIASDQIDFPLPPAMVPDLNESTAFNPLSYLEYFICKNGIINLKNKFIPTDDDYDGYEQLSYNSETEIKSWGDIDQETGEWETYTQSFSNILLSKLWYEYNKCRTLIDEHINGLPNEERAVFYLKLTLDKLRYLIVYFESQPNIVKYKDVPRAVRGLIKYCYEKYKSFCPDPEKDEIFKACLKDSKLYQLAPAPVLLQISAHRPGVFIWKKPEAAPRLNTVLHDGLNTFYISEVELTAFSQIFDGGNPQLPLNLKWIDKSKSGAVNKATLLYLFKELEEKGLIDCQYGTEKFLRKLEYIFKDSEGRMLKNWPQSLFAVKKGNMTPQKKIIAELVSKMADEKAV